MWWKGLLVAMVTPFREDGSVDVEGIREIVKFHVESGTDVLVPCGTTGEVATLFEDEWELVIKTVVDAAAGEIKVVGGAGGYNTAEVVKKAKRAEQLGVDGILSVCPYYNKPTQEGLYQHFRKIAESVSIPIIVYNVPSRTSRNI
ncbi:MAG: dihydrodipicolinate synthase family protein, partial [Synergistetes bacterium]|nr:dihydrodipicolinate synthase family protein [Synergistota bacterium]